LPRTDGAPADVVLGQPDFAANTAACTQTGMSQPTYVAFVNGKLIVTELANNRVLIWNSIPTTNTKPADLVLGQADFTHCASNDDDGDGTSDATPSARTFNQAIGVWSDGTKLAVVDRAANRVLIWNTFPTASHAAADVVVGQATFTTGSAGATAAQLNNPFGLDSNGNQLAIADQKNHRVVIFDAIPTTSGASANHVLGQSNFAHVKANDDNQDDASDANPTSRTISNARAVSFTRNVLLVGDAGNNRVLVFGDPPCAANTHQIEAPPGSGTCLVDPCVAGTCNGLARCDHDDAGAMTCDCPGFTAGCAACVRRVSLAATGSGDGTTWADAATSIQSAIDSTIAAKVNTNAQTCEVWVQAGTYYTRKTAATDTILLDQRTILRGGFAGDEALVADRHGGTTILDGRTSAVDTNAVYHVVTAGQTFDQIDRVRVQFGNANGTSTNANGGGLLAASATMSVTDCEFLSNSASGTGGAINASQGITVTGSTFTGNHAGGFAGALAMFSGGSVSDSIFTGNDCCTTAVTAGGAIMVRGNSLPSTFTRVTLVNNISGDAGGAMDLGGMFPTVTESIIAGNRAAYGGGLYFNAPPMGMLSKSIIAGNVSNTTGGGVAVRDNAITVSSTTFVGNISGNVGAGLHQTSGTPSTITDSIFWKNVGQGGSQLDSGTCTFSDVPAAFTGTGNIFNTDPMFLAAPAFWDRTTSASITADSINVGNGATYATGDTIVVGNDGVARTISLIVVNAITFSPALSANAATNTIIQNWGQNPASTTLDVHLNSGSACVDTGSTTGRDMGAYP
jgi:predicted outer membrane repeat protein